jgi:hypothetical protein
MEGKSMMYNRRKALFSGKTDAPTPEDFIRVVKPVFEVIESLIEEEPENCYAFIVSDIAYDNPTVIDFITDHSGVGGWYVVPGYPYLNEDKKIEWRCVRIKDW